MQPLAVFDVDGTVFRSSLIIELVKELVSKEIFPQNAELEYEREYTRWLNRHGEYPEYVDRVVQAFMRHIKGASYSEIIDSARDVVAKTGRQTYKYTRELIKQLKKDNFYLLAVSHSPKLMVDLFCDELGFDKVYGLFYNIGPGNRFTGEVLDSHIIFNKANIIKRVLDKEDVTIKGSVGVGDTESDIPFLEMIGTPICFNPNRKLYQYAKRMNWKVIVERKDVVYEIS